MQCVNSPGAAPAFVRVSKAEISCDIDGFGLLILLPITVCSFFVDLFGTSLYLTFVVICEESLSRTNIALFGQSSSVMHSWTMRRENSRES